MDAERTEIPKNARATDAEDMETILRAQELKNTVRQFLRDQPGALRRLRELMREQNQA